MISSTRHGSEKRALIEALRVRAFLLGLDLVSLELHPQPIDGLVSENGSKKNLGNGAAKAFVETHLDM